ncbi:MAG TPA: hypothetical protein VF271_11675 [Rhodanobacteraceae bacterium]
MNDVTKKPLTNRRLMWLLAWWALGIGLVLCVIGWGLWAGPGWAIFRDVLWLGVVCVLLGVIWALCAPRQSTELVSRAYRRYVRTFVPAMVGYVLAIFVMSSVDKGALPLWARVLLGLLPVLPMLWVVVVMWRFMHDSDELERRVQQEAVYATCGVVGVVSFALGLLQAVGALSLEVGLIYVLPAMFAVYGVANWWCRRKYGLTEDGQ